MFVAREATYVGAGLADDDQRGGRSHSVDGQDITPTVNALDCDLWVTLGPNAVFT